MSLSFQCIISIPFKKKINSHHTLLPGFKFFSIRFPWFYLSNLSLFSFIKPGKSMILFRDFLHNFNKNRRIKYSIFDK